MGTVGVLPMFLTQVPYPLHISLPTSCSVVGLGQQFSTGCDSVSIHREHLVLSRNAFGCCNLGEHLVGSRDVSRTTPITKNDLAPSVSSAHNESPALEHSLPQLSRARQPYQHCQEHFFTWPELVLLN